MGPREAIGRVGTSQAESAAYAVTPADAVPAYPSRRRREGAGTGRFISRSRLAARSVYWTAALLTGPGSRHGAAVTRELDVIGVGAVRLTIVAAILVGVIATFQVATQLAEFSAEVMSARAIGWFAAREIGPILVALLIIARSAPKIAGELASMSTSGEIDALRAMGLDPVKYLVTPKLAALLIALPALTILADAMIAVGGWLGNTMVLGFTTGYYLEQFRRAFTLRDLAIGLVKAETFAIVIALIAADEGLSVERTVAAIGEAATRSVVFALIAVLGADTIINAVFYFIPGLWR